MPDKSSIGSNLAVNVDKSTEAVRKRVEYHLKVTLGTGVENATPRDWWMAACRCTQDYLMERMIATQGVHAKAETRRVYYLSLEYLMGQLFLCNLHNAGIYEPMKEALSELGFEIDDLAEEEYDMALGNGGLGRLAACFLDSMATLDLPAVGYGIRYEFGLFRQAFVNGHQVEHPDSWLKYGDVWELVRSRYVQTVHLYGEVENVFDENGRYRSKWIKTRKVIGIPYDIPIAGYGTPTVNFLRLWESRAEEDIDLSLFNQGGYVDAVREKNLSETISKVLYPNDTTENGKELRLAQQYFFVACSLRDILRRFERLEMDWTSLPEKIVVQLNDTHPAVAVAELMRILHDEKDLPWEKAWTIVTRVFAYTNHTLLPEALERWSVPLFQKVLPRHLQIILEINRRLLNEVEEKWPGDGYKRWAMSLVEEGPVQMIRMANLAVVASFSVNGVAALHTELLRRNLFPEFEAFYPGKFNNKTNGITPRRWLLASNPSLSDLITRHIGDEWIRDLDKLRALEKHAGEPAFQKEFMAIKRANKVALAAVIQKECGVTVSPDALFDVQIKRLHEYKRQHLNLLHILTLYRRILQNPELDITPRVFVFAAKAAPGYDLAKCIIKAINAVAEKINHDPRVRDRLKVVFLPNYRVSLAMKIIPAADLSEQISTAGKEASGTGNMKLALNGALTIGTLDGANIEIHEEVGDENIFIFGLNVDEVEALRRSGYSPWKYYEADEELKTVIEWIASDYFTPGEHGVLQPIRRSLLDHGDPFMVLADYRAYCECQGRVDKAYRDRKAWARSAILNVARVGKFSSDRTISDYNRDVWKIKPVHPKA